MSLDNMILISRFVGCQLSSRDFKNKLFGLWPSKWRITFCEDGDGEQNPLKTL